MHVLTNCDHFTVHTYTKSSCGTSKTNTMLYVNFVSINNLFTRMWPPWEHVLFTEIPPLPRISSRCSKCTFEKKKRKHQNFNSSYFQVVIETNFNILHAFLCFPIFLNIHNWTCVGKKKKPASCSMYWEKTRGGGGRWH